jgi:ABC-type transporter Mla subunit MlaD
VTLSLLQKRIINLSSRIISTDDLEEFDRIASELKSALREHADTLRRTVQETKNRLAHPPVDPTRARTK